MAKIFTPREGQPEAIEHIHNHRRAGVWMPMGGGKTVSTLTAIEDLNLVEDVYPMLVLAPKRVAVMTWPEEVKKWQHLQHLEVSPILGTPREREAALRRDVPIYTINYDNLVWLRETMGDQWKFPTVVADELSRLKSFRLRQGGRRARALGEVAHDRVKRFIGLTGTPSSKGLQDLWGQTWFLDKGERLGRTFSAFEQRWFRRGYDGYGLEPMPHAEAEIHEILSDLYVTIEGMDVDEPNFVDVYVDLPPKVASTYKELERHLFSEIEAGLVTAANAADKTNKLAQVTAGAIYTDEKRTTWEVLHDEKLDALESILQETGGAPVLVAYRFRHDLQRLLKRFPQGRVLDANPDTLRQWNEGKIRLLFAHPKSAGHGLNMADGGCNLVFFSLDWNLEEFLQIIERIGPMRQKQAGYDRVVNVFMIKARGTIDEVMHERHKTKKKTQDLLLEAMVRSKT